MFALRVDLSELEYANMSLNTTVRLVSGKMNSETPVPTPNPVKKASRSFLINASACNTVKYRSDNATVSMEVESVTP
jgi:predicted lipase